MKKYALMAVMAVLAAGCSGSGQSEEKPQSCPFKESKASLTDEQRACLKKQGCGEKPGKDAAKETRKEFWDCKKESYESCGIEKDWDAMKAKKKEMKAKKKNK
ncbi:MAG: hypothetical protein LBB23_00260 [Rickettsiales bacterium]|nr:hypothetical protein [Rickettsiales bacterium]